MRDLFVKFGFGLVSFSCIPSFNLLLCLELVKKLLVVVVAVETNYSVKLKLKLNNLQNPTCPRYRAKLAAEARILSELRHRTKRKWLER